MHAGAQCTLGNAYRKTAPMMALLAYWRFRQTGSKGRGTHRLSRPSRRCPIARSRLFPPKLKGSQLGEDVDLQHTGKFQEPKLPKA